MDRSSTKNTKNGMEQDENGLIGKKEPERKDLAEGSCSRMDQNVSSPNYSKIKLLEKYLI